MFNVTASVQPRFHYSVPPSLVGSISYCCFVSAENGLRISDLLFLFTSGLSECTGNELYLKV